jgi:hypothetical protein
MHTVRTFTCLSLALALAACQAEQTREDHNVDPDSKPLHARGCATDNPTLAEMDAVNAELAAFRQLYAAAGEVTIPVVWHVVHDGSDGNLSSGAINASINVLNDSFAGSTGGAATPFQFSLTATTYTDNANWYDNCHVSSVESQMKSALRQGGASTLNVYSCGMGGSGLLG